MNRTTIIPAGILAALLGGGCEPESGVSLLRGYELSVTADNVWHDPAQPGLTFWMRKTLSAPRHSGCATVKDASVRFNGEPISVGHPGGPGGHEYLGCDPPSIRIPVAATATTPADATLEMEDDGGKAVVSLPGLYVRRQLQVVSVSAGKAILRGAPSFEGAKIEAYVGGGSAAPLYLETIVAGAEIHVVLTGVWGPQELRVDLELPDPPIARCEGLESCRASALMNAKFMIDVP